jgi:hypothetical protein
MTFFQNPSKDRDLCCGSASNNQPTHRTRGSHKRIDSVPGECSPVLEYYFCTLSRLEEGEVDLEAGIEILTETTVLDLETTLYFRHERKSDSIPEGYMEVMPAPEKLDEGTTKPSPRLTSVKFFGH